MPNPTAAQAARLLVDYEMLKTARLVELGKRVDREYDAEAVASAVTVRLQVAKPRAFTLGEEFRVTLP